MAFLERFVNPDTRIDTILENQSTDISNRNKHILFVIVGGHKGMWDAMFAIKGTQR